jgi:hypothetical protein
VHRFRGGQAFIGAEPLLQEVEADQLLEGARVAEIGRLAMMPRRRRNLSFPRVSTASATS